MKKLTQEYVENCYKQYNYLFIDKYINCKTKHSVICSNGHEIKMSFNSFNSGHRCSVCSNNVKYEHDYVFKFYAKENYKLLTQYINCTNHDKLICPEGHEIKIQFYSFKQGKRCLICYRENLYGENHPRYRKDRSRRLRSNSLYFDVKNIKILKDDPNYEKYVKSYEYVKEQRILKNNNHIKCNMVVDHIFPRIAFIDNNLDKIYDIKVIKEICNCRENLRIISYKDNLNKSGKYDNDKFMVWFNKKIESVI